MTDTELLEKVREAIRTFHIHLDMRANGNEVAMLTLVRLEGILDMPWRPGVEKEREDQRRASL